MSTNKELRWRKSSYSSSDGSNCLEIADAADGLMVRNSTRPDEGTLHLTRREWACLIAGVKAGELDDLVS